MNKLLKYIVAALGVLSVIYFIGFIFFLNRFTFGSHFGDVSLVGLTKEQAVSRIEQSLNTKQFKLTEQGQVLSEVSLGELQPRYELEQAVATVYDQQDPVWWPLSIGESYAVKVTADMVQVDGEQALLAERGIQNEQRTKSVNAEIQYTETQGYAVVPDVTGTQVDMQLLAGQLLTAAQGKETTVDITQAYMPASITAESEQIKQVMTLIEQVKQTKITLHIAGEQVVIPSEKIESWLMFDQQNQIAFDREGIETYLNELNEKYATFNKVRKFKSTLQGEVSVQPGILGWQIDIEKELPALEANLLARQDVTRSPAIYSTGGKANEKDDIGNTYVEVDIANQMLFMYEKGVQTVATNVVTGQPGAPTEPGANAVNEMLTNTNLVGRNHIRNVQYSVPVSYWIRFDNNAQGIHDASWQSSFGGDTYQWHGSLGCVNTPLDQVAYIYEHVDYGTPVIVY